MSLDKLTQTKKEIELRLENTPIDSIDHRYFFNLLTDVKRKIELYNTVSVTGRKQASFTKKNISLQTKKDIIEYWKTHSDNQARIIAEEFNVTLWAVNNIITKHLNGLKDD